MIQSSHALKQKAPNFRSAFNTYEEFKRDCYWDWYWIFRVHTSSMQHQADQWTSPSRQTLHHWASKTSASLLFFTNCSDPGSQLPSYAPSSDRTELPDQLHHCVQCIHLQESPGYSESCWEDHQCPSLFHSGNVQVILCTHYTVSSICSLQRRDCRVYKQGQVNWRTPLCSRLPGSWTLSLPYLFSLCFHLHSQTVVHSCPSKSLTS